jgi:hypothetical protein
MTTNRKQVTPRTLLFNKNRPGLFLRVLAEFSFFAR